MEQSNVTQIIIDTINTILGNLFSSIDNNLYNLLDDITFVDAGILHDKNFENIFGTSTSNGILLIANSLLLGIILYFAIRYLLSHFTYSKIESPHSFLIKLIICGICMNCSYFLLSQFLDIFSNVSLAIRNLGESLFNKNICFSELILDINKNISVDVSSIDVFSLDGLIKSIISVSLLNLVFSYSLRYILIKVFVLIAPFAILSNSLLSTSWFFKSWFRNLFSLLFIQVVVSIILLILFSIDYSASNLFSKFIYIGGLYALIKANSFVREFLGGVSTDFSQNVGNFSKFLKYLFFFLFSFLFYFLGGFMKFIFPQNYNFKNKLFGVIEYSTIFLNLIWDLFVFIFINLFKNLNVKIFLFFILCFPLLLFSFSGFNGESIIYVLKYIVNFLIKQKLYLFKKSP